MEDDFVLVIFEYKSDHRRYTRNLSSSEIKAW